ncbi:MAG: 2-C-methyl-D-erythritol 2,4-cyclodiphosphate synthase [Bacteroidota bacterium]
MKIKVGFGFDVHQLKSGNSLNLGGIVIPHYKGTVGHSDADVVIHSLIDALFGAANLHDIGYHFPDNDQKYKDIDSKILLKQALALISEKSYSINNIDITICLQTPKLMDYIEKMKKKLSEILEMDTEDISIKATTTEKLGYIGTEDGVSCYSVVLLIKK